MARTAHLVARQLAATHPALLAPAMLMLTAMAALALALLAVAALAALAVGVAASLALPALVGLNLLLGAPVHVLAAVLLHDAPDFVPDAEERARRITTACGAQTGAQVVDFIHALHAEHEVLADPTEANTDRHLATLATVPWLLHAATADKIVAFEYVTGRAAASGDPGAFWAARPAFTRLVPYFHRVHRAGLGSLPASMSTVYGGLLARCPAPAEQRHPG